jgi:hypothetical protein
MQESFDSARAENQRLQLRNCFGFLGISPELLERKRKCAKTLVFSGFQ